RADDRRRSGLRSRAPALAARRVDLDGNLGLDTLQRVLEGQVDGRLDVGAPQTPLAAATRAAPPAAAEQPPEDVAEVPDVEVGTEVDVAPAEPARTAVGAEGVVLLPLLGIGEEVVGGLDVLEALLGLGVL